MLFAAGRATSKVRVALLSAALLFSAVPACSGDEQLKRNVLPSRVLWAWQRDEDLSFINPKEFGVAYLACRAVLNGDDVRLEWRQHRLKVPPTAVMVPTLRIDINHHVQCALNAKQRDAIVDALLSLNQLPRVAQIQIDFDALCTERPFYKALLATLKYKVSMTSLASWCIFDDWISDLPATESVPMMFSLGREREKILSYYRSGGDFRVGRCCDSLGLSLEEPDVNQLMIPLIQKRKMPCRVYVFTKNAWTPQKVKAVHDMLGAK